MTQLKRLHTLFPMLLLGISVQAQLAVPFKKRFESFVKGDMAVIANTITNRVDRSGSTSSEYNNLDKSALHNDEFTIKYIDIDTDETTFSSSSARFLPSNPAQKKVIYAGLYWSATYPYNAGDMKKEGKFISSDANRENINQIKIKLPGAQTYTPLTGEILFDGFEKKDFKDCAPYAVYADITSLVTALKNPFGEYTVADIRAAQGKISGGVASGWTLFLVYEDQTMSGKFITSFDGFAGVTDRSTDIEIGGFKTVSEGDISATLAFAALEGDTAMSGDQLLFRTGDDAKFINLQNTLRKPSNFFNSTINNESGEVIHRFPASLNTLGYDTGIIQIANPNNSVVANNSTSATLRLKSVGDRFYMFFSAFNVEVSEHDFPFPTKQNQLAENPAQEPTQTTVSTDEFGLESKAVVTYELLTEDLTDIKYIEIENAPAGYYIIANVFEQPYYLQNFLTNLKNKNVEANSFYNPNNRYNYVYLAKTTNKEEAVRLFTSGVNRTYNDKIWILSVNNRNEQVITSDE